MSISPSINKSINRSISPSLAGVAKAIFTGTVGASVSTPTTAANRVTGDIDVRWRGALTDWSPPTDDRAFITAFAASPEGFNFRCAINTGRFALFMRTVTSGITSVLSSVAPTVTDGSELSIRYTRVVSTGVVTFFTAVSDDISDNDIWTQLGTTQVLAAGEDIATYVSDYQLGATAAGATTDNLDGFIRHAQVYDGINGTLVYDSNMEDYITGDNFTSSTTGEIQTLNGNVTISRA